MKTDTYEIIMNEDTLDEYIDWLSDTTDNTQYYLTLLARKKYCVSDALSYDKTMLKRFTSTKNNIKQKIRQLECRVGAYVGVENRPIPQEALALYITPSPRDLRAASFKTIRDFATYLEQDKSFNPRQEIMNSIHKSQGEHKAHVFDLDGDKLVDVKRILEYTHNAVTVVQTCGGYHVIMTSDALTKNPNIPKDWYPFCKKYADVSGDALTPVVGCYQGGFVPNFYKK